MSYSKDLAWELQFQFCSSCSVFPVATHPAVVSSFAVRNVVAQYVCCVPASVKHVRLHVLQNVPRMWVKKKSNDIRKREKNKTKQGASNSQLQGSRITPSAPPPPFIRASLPSSTAPPSLGAPPPKTKPVRGGNGRIIAPGPKNARVSAEEDEWWGGMQTAEWKDHQHDSPVSIWALASNFNQSKTTGSLPAPTSCTVLLPHCRLRGINDFSRMFREKYFLYPSISVFMNEYHSRFNRQIRF